MTDRPIIFSAPMIRALLDGRKTQERRVLKSPYGALECMGGGEWKPIYAKFFRGDRLLVREHWRTARAYDDLTPSALSGEEPVKYEADGTEQMWGWPHLFLPGRFRQGGHMPRWASRLTLTVTDVRVQRVQEISAEDSVAEGVQCGTCEAMNQSACHGRGCFASIDAFRDLWNSIHGPGAWDANPWVAAISFTVERRNIDEVAG